MFHTKSGMALNLKKLILSLFHTNDSLALKKNSNRTGAGRKFGALPPKNHIGFVVRVHDEPHEIHSICGAPFTVLAALAASNGFFGR